MKIAFTGTHGTGKTTLTHDVAGALKKKGYDIGIVTEVARNCPFPVNENTTENSQLWISLNMINKELEAQQKYEYVICNRSILCAYAYTSNILTKVTKPEIFKNLFEYWINTYDVLLYTPIRYKLQKDFIRSGSEEFQRTIDDIIKKILNKNDIKFFEVPQEDNINFIVTLFENQLKKNNLI